VRNLRSVIQLKGFLHKEEMERMGEDRRPRITCNYKATGQRVTGRTGRRWRRILKPAEALI